MNRLDVLYVGHGEHITIGQLLDTGREIVFEYSAQAIQRGLNFSPLRLPLPPKGAVSAPYRGERAFHGLPGFVADALPDGWGMLLMDRVLRKMGKNPAQVSVLERLAIVGHDAMGALEFEPAQEGSEIQERIELKQIAKRVAELSQSDAQSESAADSELLRYLRLGGSPQGARPKVLVQFNPRTATLSSGLPLTGAGRSWLIKFPAQGEHKEVCALEELYARIARKLGHELPTTQYFDLGPKFAAFGVERFDRRVVKATERGQPHTELRIHISSASALLHADHRLPSLDYETLGLATLRLTGDRREVNKLFARCVLNLLLHNRDDHAKNFAFRLDAQGMWKLTPVFDLTYSDGPGGEHSTSVMGQGKAITAKHLQALGAAIGVDSKNIASTLVNTKTEAMKCIKNIAKLSQDLPIRKPTLAAVLKTIEAQAEALV